MNAIEVNHLTKAFGARRAVDDVSFDLPEGSFLSIFGSNGAGKTTLLRMLSTLSRPSSGSIGVSGLDPRKHPDEVRERIGCISHSSMLYPDLTAEENLIFYARLYGIRDPEARANHLLDAVGLAHRKLDLVRTFSRGMMQRVSIARALIHDPKIVLLDEPYSGLDPHAAGIFDELICQVRHDCTFVMVSHDLAKGFDMCTHVLVMSHGRAMRFACREEIDFSDFSQEYSSIVGLGVS